MAAAVPDARLTAPRSANKFEPLDLLYRPAHTKLEELFAPPNPPMQRATVSAARQIRRLDGF